MWVKNSSGEPEESYEGIMGVFGEEDSSGETEESYEGLWGFIGCIFYSPQSIKKLQRSYRVHVLYLFSV